MVQRARVRSQSMTALPYEVHIIESPKAVDILDKRSNRTALREVLQQAEVPVHEYLAVSDDAFLEALARIVRRSNAVTPIIHLVVHGNNKGIELTDATFLPWDELGAIFSTINEALSGNLVLAMSACQGFWGIEMVAKENLNRLPYARLVGPWSEVEWQDALVAFVTFYHLVLQKDRDPFEAADAMNVAAGIPAEGGFRAVRGSTLKEMIEEDERKERIAKAIEHLRRRGLLGSSVAKAED